MDKLLRIKMSNADYVHESTNRLTKKIILHMIIYENIIKKSLYSLSYWKLIKSKTNLLIKKWAHNFCNNAQKN